MQYRKKPVVVEAFRLGYDPIPPWFSDALKAKTVVEVETAGAVGIHTPQGTMRAGGDWIIQGVRGELYPCSHEVFEQTYKDSGASAPESHPLFPVFIEAIMQATSGKGVRHGGAVTPFTEQPWVHYAKLHGRGFLTGQAAKKLEEAASTREGVAFDTEVFGAMVYLGMSILKNRGVV